MAGGFEITPPPGAQATGLVSGMTRQAVQSQRCPFQRQRGYGLVRFHCQRSRDGLELLLVETVARLASAGVDQARFGRRRGKPGQDGWCLLSALAVQASPGRMTRVTTELDEQLAPPGHKFRVVSRSRQRPGRIVLVQKCDQVGRFVGNQFQRRHATARANGLGVDQEVSECLAGVFAGQVTVGNRGEGASSRTQPQFPDFVGVELSQQFFEFGGRLGAGLVRGIGLMASHAAHLVEQRPAAVTTSFLVEPGCHRAGGGRSQVGEWFTQRRQESRQCQDRAGFLFDRDAVQHVGHRGPRLCTGWIGQKT